MTDPRNRQYTNGEITVFWVPSKCIHATTCFRELIEVFNPGRRPWVNMEGAPTRRIMEVVNKCPTQALVWKYNRDLTDAELKAQRPVNAGEENPETLTVKRENSRVRPANVKIMKDGPIVVDGDFRVVDNEGKPLKSSIMTSFCRCGGSMSMPYCDGTHRKIGFSEEPD
jgi:uncharacterized Fe-S cluster protein YjdI